ncbi:MAG TPA: M20 family metallopeptidase [Ktedonobacterales bacterium]
MTTGDLKASARERLDGERDKLVALSHRIHAHPELAYEEERAAAWLTEYLADAGMAVEAGICDLPTAFAARAGSGPLHVTICAEYDALPGIGHACGHNLIATMAAGAGVALARHADDAGLAVTVLGCPAEEAGNAGGKILLLERGAFAGTHAAMMVHPTPVDVAQPNMLAVARFNVRYTGKEAHAAASPELGINAADALTVAQVAIGLLRQSIRGTDRIHGITTHGGDAPNVIPAHTAATYLVRAETLDDLQTLIPRVFHCFEAGALATGATLEIEGGERPYAQMRHHAALAALYERNALALGRTFVDAPVNGSTDMGNVSLAIPSIHPMIGVNSLPAVNHQPEFAAACVTPAADQSLYDGALAMAWTALDLAADPALRDSLLAGR